MKKISPSELSIMIYLWTEEEAGRRGKGFGDIFAAMGEGIAKQTVNTYMMRLTLKGYLTHEGKEGYRQYMAKVSRSEYAFSLLQTIYPDMSKEKAQALQKALKMSGPAKKGKEEKEGH